MSTRKTGNCDSTTENSSRCRIKRRIRARVREKTGDPEQHLEIRLHELDSGTWEARVFLRNNNESETSLLQRFHSRKARDAADRAIQWLRDQFAVVNFESSRSE